MDEEGLRDFDEALLLAFRSPEDPARLRGPAWEPELVRDLTALGGVAVLTLVVGLFAGFLLLEGSAGGWPCCWSPPWPAGSC